MSILNNTSRLNKIKMEHGLKIYRNISVTPYIIERKIMKEISKYLKLKNVPESDIKLFDNSIRDFKDSKLFLLKSTIKEKGIEKSIKMFFIRSWHLRVYKDYNI